MLNAGPPLTPLAQIGLGIAFAAVAVFLRSLLPLNPQQMPTITVVISVALATTFFGVRTGATCAVAGGLACWYLFFNPRSWSLAGGAWIPLLGFSIIALVIITTSYLYRRSERVLHERALADVAAEADRAKLFAGELAHRLKNTLTIVQALALQTLDGGSAQTRAFTDRLRALAKGNDLLSHHVSDPSARLDDVVRALVTPLAGDRAEFRLSEARLSSSDVITLALSLHELATNATKYGALSCPSGRIIVSSDDLGRCLRLTWKEYDGPPVRPPERSGFGVRLLRRAGMNACLDFEADGVRCTFDVQKQPGG